MVQIVCGPVQLFLNWYNFFTSLIFVNQVPINCLKKSGKVQQWNGNPKPKKKKKNLEI